MMPKVRRANQGLDQPKEILKYGQAIDLWA